MLKRISCKLRLRDFFAAALILGLGLGSSDAGPAESVTLVGTFTNQGKTYPLKGVFTRSKDGTWSTTWEFTFGKRGDQVFKGTATGELGTGRLKGEVVERRRFVFEGIWEKGHFTGTTAEYFKPDGDPSPTGTLELEVDNDPQENAK